VRAGHHHGKSRVGGRQRRRDHLVTGPNAERSERDRKCVGPRADAEEYGKAMDWLEEAYRVRDPNLPGSLVSPIYDPLRSDPRFQDLLRKMNLPVD
jgi:hypothetical protein